MKNSRGALGIQVPTLIQLNAIEVQSPDSKHDGSSFTDGSEKQSEYTTPKAAYSTNRWTRRYNRKCSVQLNRFDIDYDLIKLEHLTKDKMVLSKKLEGKQTRQEKLAALHSRLWMSAQKPCPKDFYYEQKGALAVF